MAIKLVDYTYFLAVAIFTVIGQLAIKSALNKYGVLPENLQDKLHYFIKVLFDPYVILGFFLAFLAALCWLAVMSKFDLSHAYPLMIATLTLITVVSAAIFLGEPISVFKLIGVALIVAGVVTMSL